MERFRLRKGDLLVCEGGEVGRAALWDAPIEECYYQKALHRLRPLRGFDPRLMVGFLRQWTDRGVLSNYVTQTSIAHLPREKFLEVPMPVPPPPEQRAIAEALSDMDRLLGGLDRLIVKKRDLKQAAMQQLLTGETRLPGFAPPNLQFTKTPVGVFPEDWKLVQLSDLVEPARGIRYGIVQPGDYDPDGRYMIRGQDYSEVKGWAEPSEVFRVSAGIEERYRNARVKTGDLIMTIVGYCGHVEMIPDWLDGANLTQTTARIAVQPEMAVSAYCKYALLSPIGRNQVAAYLKGAAQPGLNCGDVEQFLLPLPGTPEQTAIAEVLTDMDAELAALEQRREKTRALKQAMMQELLTGRTRLV
jgi:type I restriction enzyme, S subunit